ncbi:MAG: hypothetical protein A2157_01725 [Deltaproteobacteria bacterium RBG_16_47_11]|nr:MAG: hypothetical protein A2157_01725 [Deltaproteobacteria bacterium RBG_16_47_11]
MKVFPEKEAIPGKGSFAILFGQGGMPLLLWRVDVKGFSQKESLGGIGMEKLGTRSCPPLKSGKSLTLPSELATRSGKLKEKKFIN